MRIFFLSLILLISLPGLTQDTSLVKSKLFVPVGCYYSQKSFFNKTPDSEKPFRVVKNYYHKQNGDSINYGSKIEWKDDSTGEYSNAAEEWLDSSGNPVKIFCFFDGKDMYLHSGKLDGSEQYILKGKGLFYKMDGIGKFPYTFAKSGFSMPVILFFVPLTEATQIATLAINSLIAANSAVNMNRAGLFYFNKKREFVKATPERIAWLLMKDKDFYHEYEKEKKVTIMVMHKYLQKMNDRYPGL
jgi:hypothetical protein